MVDLSGDISPSDQIWRYMDFTKYAALLDTKALFFARADTLGDKWEGSLSEVSDHERSKRVESLGLSRRAKRTLLESMSRRRRRFLKFVAINCWHIGETESAAMWSLYAPTDRGITIRSTFGRLCRCLEDTTEVICIGRVNYVDYKTALISDRRITAPFFYKRNSFLHEQELRALIRRMQWNGKRLVRIRNTPHAGIKDGGISLPVDLSSLISSVRIAPGAPWWFVRLVRSITEQHGLEYPVRQSNLDRTPIY